MTIICKTCGTDNMTKNYNKNCIECCKIQRDIQESVDREGQSMPYVPYKDKNCFGCGKIFSTNGYDYCYKCFQIWENPKLRKKIQFIEDDD